MNNKEAVYRLRWFDGPKESEIYFPTSSILVWGRMNGNGFVTLADGNTYKMTDDVYMAFVRDLRRSPDLKILA